MTVAIATHLDSAHYARSLARDVRHGLAATPKTLPPKYFYDARGSELFDQITRLPEYYPTRTERSILRAHAAEIAALTGAQTLNELGSGTSEKTRLLLDALYRGGTLRTFMPFDVDAAVLAQASETVAADYPSLDVHAVVGDFEEHLALLPRHPKRLVAFLGSTIGNLEPTARSRFLRAIRDTLNPGDAFLLGTDLVKDRGRLLAAYDDAAGITAEFNRNVLTVVNRELDADFDPESFAHVALWDADREWIEMRLRAVRAVSVSVRALKLTVEFAAGEEMRTEISAKFRRERMIAELSAAGLHVRRWWTDPADDFALSLSVPV
ncbi:MAG: histidyl-tRNA synthetase [Pseudonocardiales bacterium]|nr:histidyl-tRNA synthetase [Pseudonocardiales bacterium]